MTKVIQKKNRVLESINATRKDIENLYVATILIKTISHFQKKLFNGQDEFREEAFELYLKLMKTVKCPKGLDRYGKDNITVETIDGVSVSLIDVLAVIGQKDFYDQEKLMEMLCYKHDKGREFKIIPIFQEIIESYWSYGD